MIDNPYYSHEFHGDCDPVWDGGEIVRQAHIGAVVGFSEDVLGHLGRFGVAPTYMSPIDQHLGELLDTAV